MNVTEQKAVQQRSAPTDPFNNQVAGSFMSEGAHNPQIASDFVRELTRTTSIVQRHFLADNQSAPARIIKR
jgi:hypothetical protein